MLVSLQVILSSVRAILYTIYILYYVSKSALYPYLPGPLESLINNTNRIGGIRIGEGTQSARRASMNEGPYL